MNFFLNFKINKENVNKSRYFSVRLEFGLKNLKVRINTYVAGLGWGGGLFFFANTKIIY